MMPAVSDAAAPSLLHGPGDLSRRPKGILKNPSFCDIEEKQVSPTKDASADPSVATGGSNPAEQKELTLQNTLQNAGHRQSSSAVRRTSASTRSQLGGLPGTSEEGDNMRLKWDEANLYLAEQQKSSTMKITEPKTPYEYARELPEQDESDEDGVIDPRFVEVDELDKQKRARKGGRESEIPGLELGDPEELGGNNARPAGDSARIVRDRSLSQEGSTASREKHVNVAAEEETPVGMPTGEELEKHKRFEEHRKKHYEMSNVKGMLGHPETIDAMDEDDGTDANNNNRRTGEMPDLPSRGVNGAR